MNDKTALEKPLVTFALFAYNQEKYIREAVEGAFSQTYEPLEIILSDDCSTDRTFEIMQEMADSYRGTKKIVSRQTHSNMGTLMHVTNVANIAEGGLIVLAAGDDISKKERTNEIVNEWLSTGAWGFYSKFDRIDENGKVVVKEEDPRKMISSYSRLRAYLFDIQFSVEIIIGATSAYDKKIFNFLNLLPSDYILAEDGVLSVLLNMLGKEIKFIDISLINYRENEQSLTNSKKNRNISLDIIKNDECKIKKFDHSQANRCELFIRLNDEFGREYQQLDTNLILNDLMKHRKRETWWEIGFTEKLGYLKNNSSWDDIKWVSLRFLPMPIFLLIKTFIRKIL